MSKPHIIKVFLASSDELRDDRESFGNFVRRLDDLYEKRNKRIKLFEWEDSDAAYNNRRKQGEYNDEVRASDMFLALFYIKAGKYTIEEFKVATEEYHRTGYKPKPYVYLRELKEGDQESDELISFKHHLSEELGYYWCNYNSRDSLQLHFVMQLLLVENNRLDELKLEDGKVMLDGTTIARMENLKFAADNPDYQRMKLRLMELPSLIEKVRLRIEKYPDDVDLQDDLQRLIKERNKLQEDFDKQQNLLFETAKRIAKLQGEQLTNRLRRAIDASDRGAIHEANNILDKAEFDAKHVFNDFRHSNTLNELNRQNVHKSIEELLFRTSTMMADASFDIQERIIHTKFLYAQVDEMASEVGLEKEKYCDLLFDYARFLFDNGLYKEAETIYLRQISLAEELFGLMDKATAISFNNIGVIYKQEGDYSKALEYYYKALYCTEKCFGGRHPQIAILYNNIGAVYHNQGDYSKALKSYEKAMIIIRKIHGTENLEFAASNNNLGILYLDIGDISKALELFSKALNIAVEILGAEHPYIASTYNNIGRAYQQRKTYNLAFENYEKALSINKMALGIDHPQNASIYNNIGSVYHDQNNIPMALEYYGKALAIDEKALGLYHIDTASTYNNLGLAYKDQGDNLKALNYYSKALEIYKKNVGIEHPLLAITYTNMGMIYDAQDNLPTALDFFDMALQIREKVLGTMHPDTALEYNNIGAIYCKMKDYDSALKYFNKSLKIYMTVLGPEHYDTRNAEAWIALVKILMGNSTCKKRLFGNV